MFVTLSKAARIEKKLKDKEAGSQLLVNRLTNSLELQKKRGKTSPAQAKKKRNSLSPLISPVLTPPSTHKRR